MKKFLKTIWDSIRSFYYTMLLICGMLGIVQVASTAEPKDINILIVTVSFFAIGYSAKNIIKITKEILE